MYPAEVAIFITTWAGVIDRAVVGSGWITIRQKRAGALLSQAPLRG